MAAASAPVPEAAQQQQHSAVRTRRGRVSIDYDQVKAQSQDQSYRINQPHIMSGGAFGQNPVALLVALEYHLLQVQLDKKNNESQKKTSAEIEEYMQRAGRQKATQAVPLKLILNPDLELEPEQQNDDGETLEWMSDDELQPKKKPAAAAAAASPPPPNPVAS